MAFANHPGDPLLGDWAQRSADLSAFSGQTVRLTFIANAGLAYLDVHLDDVSIRSGSPPPTTYNVYFGTNQVPDQSEFLGATTNTYWPLPPLSSLTPYYWQIVAQRMNQTAGPIWQFNTLPALSINDVVAAENDSGTTNVVFTVSLPVAYSQTVSVDFATADGTAVAPDDYVPTNGTVVFNPGQTNKGHLRHDRSSQQTRRRPGCFS